MKRLWLLILAAAMLLCGCGKEEAQAADGKKWDCSVVVPVEDPSCIAFGDARLQTNSGELSFQNRNAFPVHLYLYKDGIGELVTESEIQSGGVFAFVKAEADVEYVVGFHADQPEGTVVAVMAYDGNHAQEHYVITAEE